MVQDVDPRKAKPTTVEDRMSNVREDVYSGDGFSFYALL